MAAVETEVGREEAKQRQALNKAFGLAIKKQLKASPWRMSQGVLFRDLDGWFISAPTAVWVLRRKSTIALMSKPMSLDPIFWEIVGAESNAKMPLSFRYSGSWTCTTPPLVEHELDEGSADPATMAAEAIAWLNDQMDQFKSWSTEHFLDLLRQHPKTGSYLATVVTTMFLLGDDVSAERLCREAIARGDRGGFSVGRKGGSDQSFPELALNWLDRKRASAH
jgi:hypothetical protein